MMISTRTFGLVVAIIFASLPNAVVALPTGASACPAGEAAVGGSHLGKSEQTNGPLSENAAQLKVLLNGNVLSPDTPVDVPIGVDHTLELMGEAPFRGFLFRLGGGGNAGNNTLAIDTTEALRVADGDAGSIKVAKTVCVANENVGGLTHIDNVDKTSVKGLLKITEEAGSLPLDVTVVVRNQGTVSDYAYSQFTLNAVEGGAMETTNGSGIGKRTPMMGLVAASVAMCSMSFLL
ncbi:expressed unknown protein [Seminavis robusta]|uniref:Uncharacterized protein n=1 Tax=Seminavis robusta TaxID=568900 RepID=A0A9N8H8Y0_9STRA|nr:expressed unknown protein [Seminavis robusta]|eukprot:Sro173_g076370.1 n/a (235) ;mRNA; r:61432-62136